MTPNLEYFLSIEVNLENCSRFVEFDRNNYSTYSIEFAKLIMLSSSEADSVFKLLCTKLDSTAKCQNIVDYYKVISVHFPNFVNTEVSTKYNLNFKPWANWSGSSRPSWWLGYNKIKHERDSNFNMANLENTLLSVGGLFVLLLYYWSTMNGNTAISIDSFNAPRIFGTVAPSNVGFSGGSISNSYYLPDFP